MTSGGSGSPLPPAGESASVTERAVHNAQAVERAELKETILTSIRWVAVGRFVVQVITFGAGITLARLIPPAEFGRAAIALVVVALAVVLTLQGFGAPLVRFQSLERSHVESAVLLSAVTGVLLMFATFLLAPVAADPVFGARVGRFMQIAAPAWVLVSIGTVPLALLQRRMDFRLISLIDIWSTVIGTATSVGLAAAGVKGEALVVGGVVTTASASLLYLRSVPSPLPRWHGRSIREVVAFGAPAALSSLAYTGFLNVDYAMLGARVAAAQVGYYWRGYQLAVEYQGKVSGILLRLAFPVYSRSDDLEDMKRIRTRMSRLHATLLFAPLLALIPLAPKLVPLLFGVRWHRAVLPTQILVAAGMTAAISTGIGPLLVAAGKSVALLWWNTANLIGYGAMVYFVAPQGLVAVCIAVSVYAVLFLLALYVLVERLIALPALQLFSEAFPGLVAGAGLLAVAFPVRVALSAAGASGALVVVTASAAGATAYALVLRFVFPSTWADVSLLLGKVLPIDRRREPNKMTSKPPSI